jgi:2-keto-3-deoxy-L-rhamnonate aldolase RhmA
MRINRIKQKMKKGERVYGTMIKEARNINISEILDAAGFDYFVIDMEHAFYDMSDITPILEFARKTEPRRQDREWVNVKDSSCMDLLPRIQITSAY